MKKITLIFASLYGMISVIMGALGSHVFKKILSEQRLSSFEIGVKYQMYHAIVLLILGLFFSFKTNFEKYSCLSLIIGAFLFSFSIYILSFSQILSLNTSFIGVITPLGGVLMIFGWFLLLLNFLRLKN